MCSLKKILIFWKTYRLLNYTPPSSLTQHQITHAELTVFKRRTGPAHHVCRRLTSNALFWGGGRNVEWRWPIRSLFASASPERRAPVCETRTDRNKRLQKEILDTIPLTEKNLKLPACPRVAVHSSRTFRPNISVSLFSTFLSLSGLFSSGFSRAASTLARELVALTFAFCRTYAFIVSVLTFFVFWRSFDRFLPWSRLSVTFIMCRKRRTDARAPGSSGQDSRVRATATLHAHKWKYWKSLLKLEIFCVLHNVVILVAFLWL